MKKRRQFLATSLASLPAGLVLPGCTEAVAGRKIKVAVLATSFFYRSHAHVILENFLVPYLFNAEVVDPTKEFEIAGLYVDQYHEKDMARDVAKQFGIPIFDSEEEALTLGGESLAVDAVLMIAEHGDYPLNEKGQELYPKQQFFDAILKVFAASNRVVPVYTDKHLSHTWSEAKPMVEASEKMGFALMAGSSVPLAQRVPPLDLPANTKITEAVSIHGGPLERYGFHGLEVLQSIVEARVGGETGIRSVQYLEGDALWAAADRGEWSESLATEAMKAELGDDIPRLRDLVKGEPFAGVESHGFLVRYRDGLKAVVLKIGTGDIRWNFSCLVAGEKDALRTRFHVGPWNNRNLFKALSHAIQAEFREEQSPYPVRRTLLVTGALEAAIDSSIAGGKVIDTPHLDVKYGAKDFRKVREMGGTWRIITESTPQPAGIEPVNIPNSR